jgi:hypothetical protein
MSGEHRRRYRLGFGLTVEFIFRPELARRGEVCPGALSCDWDPAIPRFPPGNTRNKFLRRYRAARNDFYQDVAQLLGGNLMNVDEHNRPGETTVFKPVVPS